MSPSTRTIVMRNTRDAKGTIYRAISLTDAGELQITGHDLGSGVEDHFGGSEYEFERSFTAAETARICDLVAAPDLDALLTTLTRRFDSTHDIEQFLKAKGLEGNFWNHISD